MVQVRDWRPADGVNTTTVFTNDFLLVARRSGTTQALDAFNQDRIDHLGEPNAQGEVVERPMTLEEAQGEARHDDEILRMHRDQGDVFILRRHHVSEPCGENQARSNHQWNLSPELSQALVYFQSGRGRGPEWCSVYEEGENNRHLGYVTNWDSASNPDLTDLLRTLDDIQQTAASGHAVSHRNLPLNSSVAIRIARAIPSSQIAELRTLVQGKMHDNRNDIERAFESPAKTLETAGWFGLGTDIYHVAKYALLGLGENPIRSAKILGGALTVFQTVRATVPRAITLARYARFASNIVAARGLREVAFRGAFHAARLLGVEAVEASLISGAAGVSTGSLALTTVGAATAGQIAAVVGVGLAVGVTAGTLLNQGVGIISRATGGDGRTLSDRIGDTVRPRSSEHWSVDNPISNFLAAHF